VSCVRAAANTAARAAAAGAAVLQGELDELEREEFFRLKKVQKNKQKVAALELARKEAAVRLQTACFSARVLLSCHRLQLNKQLGYRQASLLVLA
jgi:hydroxymethylglutaryl-CoA reductase